jgi:hypothetical protein
MNEPVIVFVSVGAAPPRSQKQLGFIESTILNHDPKLG